MKTPLMHKTEIRLKGGWRQTSACHAVMQALNTNSVVALFVGGCIRNEILDAPVKDIDIAINCPPEKTQALLEKMGIRVIPTGIEHGTITAVVHQETFEITTLRKDVISTGRRAQVAFGADWIEDAKRRDFTMNALYADMFGQVYDPLNGLRDLMARRIRFIGNPTKRVQEDYLRILRLFRFHAWYGQGEMDPPALVAAAGLSSGLEQVSRERIGQEIFKLLAAPAPDLAIQSMQDTGVLAQILPYSLPPKYGQYFTALTETESCLGLEPDPLRRLGLLLPMQASLTDRRGLGRVLRLSRQQMRRLEAFSLESYTSLDYQIARKIGYLLPEESALDWLLITATQQDHTIHKAHLIALSEGARQVFPITAQDLLAFGLSEGREMGDALKWLKNRWIESDFTFEKNSLLSDFKTMRL